MVPPQGILSLGDESAVASAPTEPIKHFEMSDDLFDFTVKIDGDVFKLPVSLEVFMSYGWKPTRELTGTLLPGDDFSLDFGSRFMFTRDDSYISVTLANMSDEVRYISKSTIIGLSTIFTNATIELPHGIRKGTSTMDDVLSAFGDPYETSENTWSGTLTLQYRPEDTFGEWVWIYIDYLNGDVVSDFLIRNKSQIDSDLISDMATVHDEVTEKERNYIVPAALGDDLSSFIVEIYGDLYRIPAPVSAFMDNGWEVDREHSWSIPTESIPRQREAHHFTLIRGSERFPVTLFNFGDKLLTVERCFVVRFDIYSDQSENIRRPGGITVGTPERRLIELLGDMSENLYEDSPTSRIYTYHPAGRDAWLLSEFVFSVGFSDFTPTGEEYRDRIRHIRILNIELD